MRGTMEYSCLWTGQINAPPKNWHPHFSLFDPEKIENRVRYWTFHSSFWWKDENWWLLLLCWHNNPPWCQEFLSARVSQKYIGVLRSNNYLFFFSHELHGEKDNVHIFLASICFSVPHSSELKPIWLVPGLRSQKWRTMRPSQRLGLPGCSSDDLVRSILKAKSCAGKIAILFWWPWPLWFLGMNVLELKFRSYKTGIAMAMAKCGVESVGTCTPMGPESLGFGAGCSAFFSIKLLIKYVDVDDTWILEYLNTWILEHLKLSKPLGFIFFVDCKWFWVCSLNLYCTRNYQ